MKHLRSLSLLAVACLALAACTPSNTKPGQRIATAIKTGQSWVVTRPIVAAQVLDTCSRDSPSRQAGAISGYWAPSRADIDTMEAKLGALAPTVTEPSQFNRQYVGFESGGKRLIYINAFPMSDHSDVNPAREAVRACDGGKQFWGAVYDPAAGNFSSIEFNGAKTP